MSHDLLDATDGGAGEFHFAVRGNASGAGEFDDELIARYFQRDHLPMARLSEAAIRMAAITVVIAITALDLFSFMSGSSI